MWSFVYNKSQQYWLWWAIDHDTGTPFAFCFGTREHCNLDTLLDLLKPFDIDNYFSDGNWAYSEKVDSNKLEVGK